MTDYFNPEQQQVIDLNTGWHACLAAAGSGKTDILTERVYRALLAGVDPKHMLCLTFTNRAALSMRQKIQQRLGASDVDAGVFIGNMHAFCYLYLQRNRVNYGVKQLANEQVTQALWTQAFAKTTALLLLGPTQVRDILQDNATQLGFSQYQLTSLNESHLKLANAGIHAYHAYERWDIKKIQRLLLPLLPDTMPLLDDDFKAGIRQQIQVSDGRIAAARLVNLAFGLALHAHTEYTALKRQLAVFDFDDLLIDTLQHLHRHPDARMSRYSWCQIDEVQDISPLQWLLIKRLLAAKAHVLLLGDLNQSIYRFMGSSIETTQLYLGQHPIVLRRNYRSPKNIVDMTNAYCQLHFPDYALANVMAEHPAQPDALLHIHHRFDTDHDNAMIRYAQNMVARQHSVAILLATNQKVSQFSAQLSRLKIDHFCINQHDIFSTEAALDFLAFITAMVEPKNRVAWSRLLWRFGDMNHHKAKHLLDTSPLLVALMMTAQLGELGCDLVDFLEHTDCYQHRMRRLVDALACGKWSFFDTETTGLDPLTDDIIQLAVMHAPKATQTSGELLNLYCQSTQDLSATQSIHGIDAQLLADQGQPVGQQLRVFLNAVKGRALIAHHLDFDHAMLAQHYVRHAPDAYPDYMHTERFCSLKLTQQLFPHLDSYKLGDLLTHFQLSGVNSHDARDDVHAGVQLIQHLTPYAQQRLDDIDAVVNEVQPAIERFIAKFSPLWQQLEQQRNAGAVLSLNQLIDLYFDHVQQTSSYALDHDAQSKRDEFKRKICRHAQQHFADAPLADYLKTLVDFYKTAKESDLITTADQCIVSTIHRAKGLEFDHVLLPAVVEDNFPSFMIKQQLEHSVAEVRQEGQLLATEQARLLYVALTRAKRQLVIGTYDLKSGQYACRPSPFIAPFLTYFKQI